MKKIIILIVICLFIGGCPHFKVDQKRAVEFYDTNVKNFPETNE